MSDETQKAARVIARDLLNAVSEGLDIAGTVDSVVHKVAAIGGAVDTAIQKYDLDSGQIAALAVLMDEVPLVEPTAIDYASIEKRIAAEWYGSVTGRSMALGEGLTIMVEGGLHSWRAAQAIYSMVSDQALDGVNDYFLEHGILPVEDETTAAMILVRLMARAGEQSGELLNEPALAAAHCGTLAFLTLVRHSEELSAMDAPPADGFVNMAHLGESPTGRNAFEPEQQQLPGNPLLQNPGFRVEPTETGRFDASQPNMSNVPKELTEATTPESDATAQCMKCHKQVVIKNPNITTQGNGSRMVRGVCPVCGTKVSKFLKKDKTNAAN